MFTINREVFVNYTQGVLLSRNEDGSFIIADNLECDEAAKRLTLCEIIGLVKNGEIISTMQINEKGEYVEIDSKS